MSLSSANSPSEDERRCFFFLGAAGAPLLPNAGLEVEAVGAELSRDGSTSTWAAIRVWLVRTSFVQRWTHYELLTVFDADHLVDQSLVRELGAQRGNQVHLAVNHNQRVDRTCRQGRVGGRGLRQLGSQAMHQVGQPLRAVAVAGQPSVQAIVTATAVVHGPVLTLAESPFPMILGMIP